MHAPPPPDLAAALVGAEPHTLAAVVTHLSADPDAVAGGSDGEGLLARAHAVLAPHVGSGPPTPPVCSDAVLQAALDHAAGRPVPPEYGPMARDQMGLGPSLAAPPVVGLPDGFHVAVIGAGFGGLGAAMALEAAGIRHTVIEKNAGVGGTWWENRYPGCGVDTPSHLYSYSGEPQPGWGRYFSGRDEVLAYARTVAERHRLHSRLRLRTEVDAMNWDDGAGVWRLRLRSTDDGTLETLDANAVIAAVGGLNPPKLPDIPGLDRFGGPVFHSARWDADAVVDGRRVAVIGSGASANQLVPALAGRASRVVVFQRSAPWMAPNRLAGAAIDERARWLFGHVPSYAQWFRFRQFWVFGDGVLASLRKDPTWPHPARAVRQRGQRPHPRLADRLRHPPGRRRRRAAGQGAARLPPYGKRMLIDHGWYRALRRPDVELVTDPIQRVEPGAVVTGHGRREVDVIVAATGFRTDRVLWPMQVVGRDGVELQRRWGDDPRGYLGTAILGCPNLFVLYGPNSKPRPGWQRLLRARVPGALRLACLAAMAERGWTRLEVRADAHGAYNAAVDAELEGYVWTHPGMSSWYKNRHGRVTTNLPWRLVDYWHSTRRPDLADFAGR